MLSRASAQEGLTVMDFVGVSAQVCFELIGAIYDCALDPQQWLSTCRKIADLCVWPVSRPAELCYWIGLPGPTRRIVAGADA